jgi:hypothetical protein
MEKEKYFKIGEALQEIKQADGVASTATSAIKLFGKSVFNIGRFAAAEVLPAVLEHTSKKIEQNENSTEEQRERAARVQESAAKIRDKLK